MWLPSYTSETGLADIVPKLSVCTVYRMVPLGYSATRRNKRRAGDRESCTRCVPVKEEPDPL